MAYLVLEFTETRGIKSFELQTGSPTEYENVGGIVALEGTDIKYTIESVSDNDTVAEGDFEYFLIDEI